MRVFWKHPFPMENVLRLGSSIDQSQNSSQRFMTNLHHSSSQPIRAFSPSLIVSREGRSRREKKKRKNSEPSNTVVPENWKASLPKITVSSLGRSKRKEEKRLRTLQAERKLVEVGGIGADFSDLEVFQ